jgi:hypothetical protein
VTYSVGTDPGGDDVGTRGPDVDESTEIGVRSLGIGDGGGTDGDSGWCTSGGEPRGVGVGVTSSDNGVDAGRGE